MCVGVLCHISDEFLLSPIYLSYNFVVIESEHDDDNYCRHVYVFVCVYCLKIYCSFTSLLKWYSEYISNVSNFTLIICILIIKLVDLVTHSV